MRRSRGCASQSASKIRSDVNHHRRGAYAMASLPHDRSRSSILPLSLQRGCYKAPGTGSAKSLMAKRTRSKAARPQALSTDGLATSVYNKKRKLRFGTLVKDGWFSATPGCAIRTNNPGALNISTWQRSRPGFVGQTPAYAAGNITAILVFSTVQSLRFRQNGTVRSRGSRPQICRPECHAGRGQGLHR